MSDTTITLVNNSNVTTITTDSSVTTVTPASTTTIITPSTSVGQKGDPGDPATNLVTSVNGKQGVVILNPTDIGLGNVDNTSDLNKPISTATQAALDALEAESLALIIALG